MFLAAAGVAGLIAVTGGTITTPTGYQVNEFTASGDLVLGLWTPSATGNLRGGVRALTFTREMVGGGGEAGFRDSGHAPSGGSGGQYQTGSDTLAHGTTNAVVVGAAGSGVADTNTQGTDGGDSTFNGHTALKGLGGASPNVRNGKSGANATAGAVLTTAVGTAGTGTDHSAGTGIGDASTAANRVTGGAAGSSGNGGNASAATPGAFGAGTTRITPGKTAQIVGEGGRGGGGGGSNVTANSAGFGAGGDSSVTGSAGEDGVAGVVAVWFPTT